MRFATGSKIGPTRRPPPHQPAGRPAGGPVPKPQAESLSMGRMPQGRGESRDGRMGEAKQFAGAKDADALFYEAPPADVKLALKLYRPVAPTMEYAENNYYHLPIAQQVAALVPVSRFWGRIRGARRQVAVCVAAFPRCRPVVRRDDAGAERVGLAVCQPQGRPGVCRRRHDAGRPAAAGVAFVEEVKPAADAKAAAPVLVTENFARADDRVRIENGESADKFITDEFRGPYRLCRASRGHQPDFGAAATECVGANPAGGGGGE